MRGLRIVIALMLIAAVAGGCGVLEPRKAEKPTTGDQFPWVVPLDAAYVFLNLKSGLASNLDSNYERSLDASFTFFPMDVDVANLGADKFADWTTAVEMQWLKRVKTTYTGARTVRFGDATGHWRDVSSQAGRVTYEGEYQISLEPTPGATAEVYAGIARFTIVQATQGWVLTEWRDLEPSGSFSSSGYLRGTLRQ